MTRTEYRDKLAAMTNAQLSQECEDMIWLSAYANNNPRSDYHWMVDATYGEALARDPDASIYVRAHKKVSNQ